MLLLSSNLGQLLASHHRLKGQCVFPQRSYLLYQSYNAKLIGRYVYSDPCAHRRFTLSKAMLSNHFSNPPSKK